jgi:glutamate/tyrosine decarboxylase-like PLP-dependent enzyme
MAVPAAGLQRAALPRPRRRAPRLRLRQRVRQALSAGPVEGFAFFEESLELSPRFRARKVWLSLRYHGTGQFRAAIGKDLGHAQLLARLITAEPTLELLAPVELSTVCFRWKDTGEANVS